MKLALALELALMQRELHGHPQQLDHHRVADGISGGRSRQQ